MEAVRGHYTCHILDSNSDWIYYDDDKFRKIHPDRVYES